MNSASHSPNSAKRFLRKRFRSFEVTQRLTPHGSFEVTQRLTPHGSFEVTQRLTPHGSFEVTQRLTPHGSFDRSCCRVKLLVFYKN
ncbi:hypothetical protein [Leptospira noguchii]|uniref:hypothetical protein n=1 Tax=Leptospira noguchii TaxID=28182 RepID=UPI001FB6405E|nr:hypothetical protein [Leptospira noguchii]UOG49054.1 hypothetical protein MAL00_01605 [Leptospira noguchii]